MRINIQQGSSAILVCTSTHLLIDLVVKFSYLIQALSLLMVANHPLDHPCSRSKRDRSV